MQVTMNYCMELLRTQREDLGEMDVKNHATPRHTCELMVDPVDCKSVGRLSYMGYYLPNFEGQAICRRLLWMGKPKSFDR